MPFYTRPNFEDRQIVQYTGNTITLSGQTNISNLGQFVIQGPILDFTGTTSASTLYTIAGVSGYINYGNASSFKIQPPSFIQSGTTGTTTVDVTGYILSSLDANGNIVWSPPIVNGGFTGNTSASCITNLYVTNLNSCSPLHIQPTNNVGDVYIGENGGVNVGIGTSVPLSKLHLNGNALIQGDVNILGNVNILGTATTINTETVQTRDNKILLNYSGTTLSAIGGGIEVLSAKTDGNSVSLTTDIYGDWNSNTGLNVLGRTDNSSGYSLKIQNSGGTNNFVVRGDGNVGIGTSSPNHLLHLVGTSNQLFFDSTLVGGAFTLSGDTGIPGLRVVIKPYLSNPATGVHLGVRTWDEPSTPSYGKNGDSFLRAGADANGLNIINGSSGIYEDYIRFYAGVDATSVSDLHIQGSGTTRGYIGMGTETPTEKLHVNGNTKITGSLNIGTIGSGSPLINLGLDSNGNVVTGTTGTGGGSGTFTGNTSASCITDLYVTNLHGCSPIIVHDVLSGNSTNNYLDLVSYNDTLKIASNYSTNNVLLGLGNNYNGTYLGFQSGGNLIINPGSTSLYNTQVGINVNGGGTINSHSLYGIEISTPKSNGSLFLVKTNNSSGTNLINNDFYSGALQSEIVIGRPNSLLTPLSLGVMGTGVGSNQTGGTEYDPIFLTTPRSYSYDTVNYDTIKNVLFGGGSDNSVYTGVTNSALIAGSGNTINSYIKNSVILGGQNITATTSNTVYVPSLNIGNVGSNTPVINLGLDSNGNVVTGTTVGSDITSLGTGLTIHFSGKTIFNLPTSPASGNISGNTTNAKFGMIQKIYHQDTVQPTFPATWNLVGEGVYFTNELNIIYAEYVTNTWIEYWIIQIQ